MVTLKFNQSSFMFWQYHPLIRNIRINSLLNANLINSKLFFSQKYKYHFSVSDYIIKLKRVLIHSIIHVIIVFNACFLSLFYLLSLIMKSKKCFLPLLYSHCIFMIILLRTRNILCKLFKFCLFYCKRLSNASCSRSLFNFLFIIFYCKMLIWLFLSEIKS